MSTVNIANADLLERIFRSDYRWLSTRLRYQIGCHHNLGEYGPIFASAERKNRLATTLPRAHSGCHGSLRWIDAGQLPVS